MPASSRPAGPLASTVVALEMIKIEKPRHIADRLRCHQVADATLRSSRFIPGWARASRNALCALRAVGSRHRLTWLVGLDFCRHDAGN